MIRHRIFGLSLLVILAACSVEEWTHSPSGDPLPAHREVVEDLREQLEQPAGSIQEMDRLSERLPDDQTLIPHMYEVGTDWKIGIVPLWQQASTAENASQGIVITLSDGPLIPAYDDTALMKLARVYPETDYSVYAVRYSASKEWEAEGLRKHGFLAFEKDRDALITFAHQLKQDNPQSRIILHATGLSALLAIDSVTEGEEVFDALVLISPWTHYLSKHDFSASPFDFGGEAQSHSTQAREALYADVMKTYFRIDERRAADPGRKWMETVRSRANFDSVKTVAFFGSQKNRTPLSEAVSFLENKGASVFESPLQHHETVMTSQEERERLRAFLLLVGN